MHCTFFSPFAQAKQKAKNVILFLGDGMGLPTVAAGRFYRGMTTNSPGGARQFSFENFDFNTLVRTYDLETMVTDSASSATAFLTGAKTRTGMLGLTGAVELKQCLAYNASVKTMSILKAASRAGKSTGIVTTTRVTHASPAAAYAHVAYRNWECDTDIRSDCIGPDCNCTDIAQQLALDNLDINVILGGGQAKFYPNTEYLPSAPTIKGERTDSQKLPELWLKAQTDKGRRAALIRSVAEYQNISLDDTEYVMGLLFPSHLPYALDKANGDPTLKDLTEKAIKILRKSEKGFFLLVEGGQIDMGHHENKAKKALTEMLELDDAIVAAMKFTNPEETLILVTADHSHAFELVGQPSRFQNLLLREVVYGSKVLDQRGLVPVAYMNGPGAKINQTREDLNKVDEATLQGTDYRQQALAPLRWSTHGGEDVGIYAQGPFSWMFHRTVDNTFIAQTMKYAMCVEPYTTEKHCNYCASLQAKWTFVLTLFTHILLEKLK
uniref:Alkaline phosphatase n=1 Tax=Schistocephalus solidus TaxID=70667 RepID=A0A0X3NWQ7_SCHSO